MNVSDWTREDVIASIRAFHARRGFQPVSKEANVENELPTYYVVVSLFGSWNAAVVAAGFRPYPARSSAQAKTMAHRDRNSA